MRPQTIQIFLPSGDPNGIRQAEITTRTVRVYDVPRSDLRSFVDLPESQQPGVYFLIGDDPEEATADDRLLLYVGESDDVRKRIKEQVEKEFWNRALIAISLTNSWTKAHTQQLEFDAIHTATRAGTHRLVNGNMGYQRKLQSPISADCAEYFETIDVLVSILGHNFLERAKNSHEVDADEIYYATLRSASAQGTYSTTGFTVFAGSTANEVLNPESHQQVVKSQQRLIAQGVLVATDEGFVFTRDHTFSSPSGAADVVYGRSANGWTEWKNANRITLDAIVRVA